MKKLIYLVLSISIFLCCGTKQEEVDKIIEDGVEVVINHLEPYHIKGERSLLTPEEEVRVDFENSEFTDLGLRETQ